MTAQNSPSDASTIFRRIAETIAAGSASSLNMPAPARAGRIQIAGNPYSRTARIEIETPAGVRAVYAKVPRVDRHNRQLIHDRLEREFRMLQQMTAALAGEPRLWVVQPVAYLPEWPALVTAEAPGPTLQQKLGTSTRRWSGSGLKLDLDVTCNNAGKWLKLFQNNTVETVQLFNLAEVLAYCSTRLDQVRQAAGDFFPAGFEDRFADHLQRLAAGISPSDQRRCARHNDYAPHNIIVAPGGLHVLDFTMIDVGDRAYDVANFWERLELLATDPLRSPALIRRLQRRFLEGYGDPGVTTDPGFLIARCKYRLTQAASLVLAEPGSRFSSWRRQRRARDMKRWLERQIADDERASTP